MGIRLTDLERAMLDGQYGEAIRFAMSVVVRMAEVIGAEELLPVEQTHIDACALVAQSNLEFIEYLVNHGGKVSVPTTLNMVALDLENWEKLGISPDFGEKATRIAQGYLALGCVPTWTCAPYQGYLTPRFGEQIAWGESNAVVYANSVIGARTNRYGDYMDVCAAITGRVPKAGLHVRENRRGQVLVRVHGVDNTAWNSHAVWAALGHLIGGLLGNRIPVVEGVPNPVSNDSLKAFGAAAASSGGIAMFHLVGITPEAPDLTTAFQGGKIREKIDITAQELGQAWTDLSSAGEGTPVDVVILGCPHFSYLEFTELAQAISDLKRRKVHENVDMLVFTHKTSCALAARQGIIELVERFGATVLLDTCPFYFPIIRDTAKVVMTNSGKCAYYAPGELNVKVAFGTLRDCVRSAVEGKVVQEGRRWD